MKGVCVSERGRVESLVCGGGKYAVAVSGADNAQPACVRVRHSSHTHFGTHTHMLLAHKHI